LSVTLRSIFIQEYKVVGAINCAWQRFTIMKLTIDQRELMILQCIMWWSFAHKNKCLMTYAAVLVPRRQPHHRSGMANLPSVGAIP